MFVEIAKITEFKKMAENIFDMTMSCKNIPKEAKPGLILQVKCGDGVTLRRPISICDADSEKETLRICFDVRGKGTKYLSSLSIGDEVDILGPLGKGYDTDMNGKRVLLAGGGIGTFPLYFTAKELIKKGAIVEVLLGFRTSSLIIMKEDFSSICPLHICTDDGSCGFCGYTAQYAEKLLNEKHFNAVYICGPLPMMKTTAQKAKEAKTPCFASLEERMGCGVGACLACVCDIADENHEEGYHKERVCAEGPVFDASKVIWQ